MTVGVRATAGARATAGVRVTARARASRDNSKGNSKWQGRQ